MDTTKGAVSRIRTIFKERQLSLTLTEILTIDPTLKPSQISMALVYLRKGRYVTRTVEQATSKGRKQVYRYTYHTIKLPKEQA